MTPFCRHSLRICVIAIFSLLCIATADAKMQRMMLTQQSFSIGAGNKQSATAICLDESGDSPAAGADYSSAPANLGKVRITAPGLPVMSLQEAIDKKILRVSGNGSYESLDFQSLLPAGDIKVSVPRNSVVAPDATYETADLIGFPELRASAQIYPRESLAQFQSRVWKLRQSRAAESLGIKPGQLTSGKYDVDLTELPTLNRWVKRRLTSSTDRAFILQRVEPTPLWDESPPMYILLSGNAPPRTFSGSGRLRDAADAISTAWSFTGGKTPPRVILYGDADTTTFDATRLTLEVAAGGGGGMDGGKPPAMHFEPPDGADLPGEGRTYKGGKWADLRIAQKNGKLQARQDIPKRGYVDMTTRAANLLAAMVSIVHSIANSPDIQSIPGPVLALDLQRRIEFAVDRTRRENGSARVDATASAEATAVIDGSTYRQKFAILISERTVVVKAYDAPLEVK